MQIDLDFPVRGDALPADHRYHVYAALAHALAAFHAPDSPFRFAAITGERGERGMIRLQERSRLRIRLPSERIGEVLFLSGRTLMVGDNSVHLGVPTATPIRAAPLLAAKVVTFKHATDPNRFLDVTRQRLNRMGIEGEPGIPLIERGERTGEPRRQILRIKGRKVIGFALQVAGLTAEESLRLQEQGLGGRRRMGCGFFMPYRPRVS